MKAVLKKIFLFLAATALLLYISAGTAYLTYSPPPERKSPFLCVGGA